MRAAAFEHLRRSRRLPLSEVAKRRFNGVATSEVAGFADDLVWLDARDGAGERLRRILLEETAVLPTVEARRNDLEEVFELWGLRGSEKLRRALAAALPGIRRMLAAPPHVVTEDGRRLSAVPGSGRTSIGSGADVDVQPPDDPGVAGSTPGSSARAASGT